MRVGYVMAGVSIALLGIWGCGSSSGLDVTGTYAATFAVDGVTTPVVHTVTLGDQASGYWLTITPADDTVAGALDFDSSSSARVAVAGGSHVLAMILNGPGSIGTYRDAAGTQYEITTGTIDLSFSEGDSGESTSSGVELTSITVILHSEEGADYSATLSTAS
jgi:hypothetical protein